MVAGVALAGRNQLLAIVFGPDAKHLDAFTDDLARERKGRVVFEGRFEAGQLLVFVVTVDRDLLDQAVEFGVGFTGGTDRCLLAQQQAALSGRSGGSAGRNF